MTSHHLMLGQKTALIWLRLFWAWERAFTSMRTRPRRGWISKRFMAAAIRRSSISLAWSPPVTAVTCLQRGQITSAVAVPPSWRARLRAHSKHIPKFREVSGSRRGWSVGTFKRDVCHSLSQPVCGGYGFLTVGAVEQDRVLKELEANGAFKSVLQPARHDSW